VNASAGHPGPWLGVTGTGRIGVAGHLYCSLGCAIDPDGPVLKG
jgi:hypothetical protein